MPSIIVYSLKFYSHAVLLLMLFYYQDGTNTIQIVRINVSISSTFDCNRGVLQSSILEPLLCTPLIFYCLWKRFYSSVIKCDGIERNKTIEIITSYINVSRNAKHLGLVFDQTIRFREQIKKKSTKGILCITTSASASLQFEHTDKNDM